MRKPLPLEMGDEVTFADDNAIADAREMHKARIGRGFVNGDAIETPNGAIYWPVFCEREGREATTIMVAESNIVTRFQKRT